MALRGIAAGYPQIKSVNFIEYFHSVETNDEDGSTQHVIVVKLNAHVYIGKYYGDTQADAYIKAKDVVKGFLVKSGCFDPDTRLPNVPYREYGFEAAIPLIDLTPDPFTFGNETTLSYEPIENVYRVLAQQITGVDQPITLSIGNHNTNYAFIYYKITSTPTTNYSTTFLSGFNTYAGGPFPIAIPAGRYLVLAAGPGTFWDYSNEISNNIQIINESDNNAVLANLTAYTSSSYGPG